MESEAKYTRDPTGDAALALIDLQDLVPSPAGPNSEVTSPATAEEFIVLDDSEDPSYILCSQVSTKRIYVLPPRNRIIMSPVMDVSVSLPTVLHTPVEVFHPTSLLIDTRDSSSDTVVYDTDTTLRVAKNSKRFYMGQTADTVDTEPVDTADTPILKQVFEAAFVQPLSCWHKEGPEQQLKNCRGYSYVD